MIRTCLLVVMIGWPITAVADDWPGFLGPDGNGISYERRLPKEWSEKLNVTWSVPLESKGNSSPIVWGDKIFLTGAMEEGRERVMMCFDRATGQMLWHNAVRYSSEEPTHDTNPHCGSTPVTNGKVVVAWFGSAGVAAFDLQGEGLWHRKDLGVFHHIWGTASSPVLFEDTVILYAGPGSRSRIMALSLLNGRTVWEHELPEAAAKDQEEWKGSWATPVLAGSADQPELILPLPGYVAAFNPKTGREIWRCRGLSDLAYASAAVGSKQIVVMSGYQGPTFAMRRPTPGDRGDLTESHRLWVIEKNPQRIGTPIIIGEHVYIINEPGVAECVEIATGKTIWKERLGKVTWGSPIYADSRFYVTDSQGATHVFDAATTFRRIANNKFDELQVTRATPAFSDGQIFIRTYDRLYCIGKRAQVPQE